MVGPVRRFLRDREPLLFRSESDLSQLFKMQDSLIEHRFPANKARIHEWIISAAGDIYRAMTQVHPPYDYVEEKWIRLGKYTTFGLTKGDFEEIRNLIAEPSYTAERNIYLRNLQTLREATLKTEMEEKRRAVMLNSLDYIQAFIRYIEGDVPPKPAYNKLLDSISEFFPKEEFYR